MKLVRLVTIAFLAVALASCCSCRKGAVKAKPLAETNWSLVEWNGRPFAADGNYNIQLNAEESRFGGRGDCNSVMGKYTATKDRKIKFEGVASTRAMCPNQEQENKFIAMLQSVDSYDIDGNLLMLFHNGELVAVMEAK